MELLKRNIEDLRDAQRYIDEIINRDNLFNAEGFNPIEEPMFKVASRCMSAIVGIDLTNDDDIYMEFRSYYYSNKPLDEFINKYNK